MAVQPVIPSEVQETPNPNPPNQNAEPAQNANPEAIPNPEIPKQENLVQNQKPIPRRKRSRPACCIGNIVLLFAVFFILPFLFLFCILSLDFSKDEILTSANLIVLTKVMYDLTVYLIGFCVGSLLLVNMVRILVATSTYYEIVSWIAREIYKQNSDDERTARRYDRDRQVINEEREEKEAAKQVLTCGAQELVEEVFTQATTEDQKNNKDKEEDNTEKRDIITPVDGDEKKPSKKSKKESKKSKKESKKESRRSKKSQKASKKSLKLQRTQTSTKSLSKISRKRVMTSHTVEMVRTDATQGSGELDICKTQSSKSGKK